MSATASDLIQAAEKYLGIKEAPPDSNNVVFNTRYYGKAVSGAAYPWCCAFQWCLFQDVGASELFYGGQKTASCTTLYNWYKRWGQTVAKESIQPGDLVFFVFDGNKKGVMNHIGLCVAVEPGYVTTIDGNTGTTNEANGGAVMRRRRALRYVGGAARPAYAAQEATKGEDGMKLYQFVSELPYGQEAVTRAIQQGYIKLDKTGAMGLWEPNLQTVILMDRAGLFDRPAVRE
ncbi:CHAP domain-containing protein [Vermiculatibacterium agrestimuris]|uniref:CHAP domain-containing protein n=1 Tax=Vermiculatibacterium agrestimuris TaxID=2941519 RepID=UPI00203F0A86|nr:CHAP domain-containing protein [Vermiculatibacterium agrestimuris]